MQLEKKSRLSMVAIAAILGGLATAVATIPEPSAAQTVTPATGCQRQPIAPTAIQAGAPTVLATFRGLTRSRPVRVRVMGVWLGPSIELRGQTEHWYFQDVYLDLVADQGGRWPVVIGGQQYTRSGHQSLTIERAVLAGNVPSSGIVEVRLMNANATDGNPTVHGGLAEACIY